MNSRTLLQLEVIQNEISSNRDLLLAIQNARASVAEPIKSLDMVHPLLAEFNLQPKSYKLLAQGDSWFDYPPGKDLIVQLRSRHNHQIVNLSSAGSTVNAIAFGAVPKNLFGIAESDAVSRIAELINAVETFLPDAVLLSGGGNDITGDTFFSFINNALSNLSNPNEQVCSGALEMTLRQAYVSIIELLLAKASLLNLDLKIFVHGYDYPWPDGRGLFIFNLVGPWFDKFFNDKNYGRETSEQLQIRYEIVKRIMDEFNSMLRSVVAAYSDRVFFVDLRNTLPLESQWANELHPTDAGFEALSDKFN